MAPRPTLDETQSAHIRGLVGGARRERETLDQQRGALMQEHEHEWVASYGGNFAFGGSLDSVLEEARRRGWPMAVVAVDKLERERPNVLL